MRKVIVGLCLIGLIYGFLNMWQTPPDKAAGVSSMLTSTLNHTRQVAHQSIEGKPSLPAAFVDKVLSSANSRAVGTGQALYDLSVKYGIDDVYALAFFQHESIYGTTGVARATLSLGNIRCSEDYQCIEGYRAYQSWQEGYVDWYKLIRNLYISQWGLRTVEQIVPKYAPASENDVAGYIAAVEKAVSTWRAGNL